MREEKYPKSAKCILMLGFDRVFLKITPMKIGIWKLIAIEVGFIQSDIEGKGQLMRMK